MEEKIKNLTAENKDQGVFHIELGKTKDMKDKKQDCSLFWAALCILLCGILDDGAQCLLCSLYVWICCIA